MQFACLNTTSNISITTVYPICTEQALFQLKLYFLFQQNKQYCNYTCVPHLYKKKKVHEIIISTDADTEKPKYS
jgi:hypothetical protein